MKRIYGVALLSACLLSGSALHAVRADNGGRNHAPAFDVYGLPIDEPITGTITAPLLTRDQILSRGNEADIVDILQLQAAYEFYHDGHNGPGVASLFVDDGIFEIPFNDGQGHFSPTGGTGGNGCAAFGPAEIAIFFNAAGGVPPLPFTAHSHHVMTSPVVRVDGDRATLNANYVDDSVNAAGATLLGHEGEYITDFVRINGQWQIKHLRAFEDSPITTANCTLAGQLPK
jgi:hypothetical protein